MVEAIHREELPVQRRSKRKHLTRPYFVVHHDRADPSYSSFTAQSVKLVLLKSIGFADGMLSPSLEVEPVVLGVLRRTKVGSSPQMKDKEDKSKSVAIQ